MKKDEKKIKHARTSEGCKPLKNVSSFYLT